MICRPWKLRIAAAGLLTACLACSRPGPPEPPPVGLEALGAAYGIEVVSADPKFPVATYHGSIDGSAAKGEALSAYTRLFVAEFGLYPPGLIRRCRLKRVVLCRDLSFAGQLRGAIPDYEHDTLYLDVSRGDYDPTYLRKVIHHEFFHVVDYIDDGLVYGDRSWSALNEAGASYGRGGIHAQEDASTSVLTDRFPGFLNHYSTTGVEEDKAEVFANLIVDPGHVAARAGTDRVLAAKVRRMHELLVGFCPEMDARFWARARTLPR